MLIIDYPWMKHAPKRCKDCQCCSLVPAERRFKELGDKVYQCNILGRELYTEELDKWVSTVVEPDYRFTCLPYEEFMETFKSSECPIQGTIDIRWRYMKDELPDPDKFQLCLVADANDQIAIGFWRESAMAWDSGYFGWLETEDQVDNYEAYTGPPGIGKVVKWMPLPEQFQPK